MKSIILMAGVLIFVAYVLFGCNGAGNINTNTARNAANVAINTAGNAANTVANAISNAAIAVTVPGAEEFLREAAQGGTAEVEMGKLAASKAQDPEIKKYGQMMVDDHTKGNAELKALAAKKNVSLPADTGSHKAILDQLKGITGAEFDKTYVETMVDDHEEDVEAFQKQADSASDPDVKAFAAKILPVLKKHLEAIKAIQARLNK